MLAQFLALYRPHRRLFLIDFGCAILSGLLELGFPMAVRGFVDQLLPTSNWTLIVVASAALHGEQIADGRGSVGVWFLMLGCGRRRSRSGCADWLLRRWSSKG